MQLSSTAEVLLNSRYMLPGETPEALFSRVAAAVSQTRKEQYKSVMENLLFLPNSPTLMNAGIPGGQLSACFVLPVGDSIRSIFTTLSRMALIHKSGGGTGFSFSRIRPAGDMVAGSAGIASGPLPFIQVFDEATNALKQGGRRRGANMGVLASSHPDIFDFVMAKVHGGLENFNLSVGFDAVFFDALHKKKDYELVNPRNGVAWETVSAETLWQKVGIAAWSCGDPGLLFLDTINKKNPVPGLGPMEATNPCGEQPLLPYESCNLGSINLPACIRNGGFDYDLLSSTVRLAVEFLDTVIDINCFPVSEIAEMTRRTRKVGLGVMGLADAFIDLDIPYESGEALQCADLVMGCIQREAHDVSRELGERLGSFPAIDMSVYQDAMRNATVTTVAPTGSLHIIAGTSSGIEPVFSLAFQRQINGKLFSFLHPAVGRILGKHSGKNSIIDRVTRTGSVQDLPISESTKDILKTASEISPEFHVKMQATVQKHVDNAVSKTVNVPETATVDDIVRIFSCARALDCKGITIYRYNSRAHQVISRGCETCRVDTTP
jgi:ribonucleoside-diphosphate reductase alpha chain